LAENLGVDSSVTFVGLLDNQAKWDALRKSDALILPSFHENFGFAVVEALACGRPALISDRVNIWPTVIDSGAGLVCRPDSAGVADVIEKWNALGLAEQEALCAAARRCYEENFSIRTTAARLLREMECVLEVSSTKRPARSI
jgi:glycosyltransferase involved in cell wall biosynthesis